MVFEQFDRDVLAQDLYVFAPLKKWKLRGHWFHHHPHPPYPLSQHVHERMYGMAYGHQIVPISIQWEFCNFRDIIISSPHALCQKSSFQHVSPIFEK